MNPALPVSLRLPPEIWRACIIDRFLSEDSALPDLSSLARVCKTLRTYCARLLAEKRQFHVFAADLPAIRTKPGRYYLRDDLDLHDPLHSLSFRLPPSLPSSEATISIDGSKGPFRRFRLRMTFAWIGVQCNTKSIPEAGVQFTNVSRVEFLRVGLLFGWRRYVLDIDREIWTIMPGTSCTSEEHEWPNIRRRIYF